MEHWRELVIVVVVSTDPSAGTFLSSRESLYLVLRFDSRNVRFKVTC